MYAGERRHVLSPSLALITSSIPRGLMGLEQTKTTGVINWIGLEMKNWIGLDWMGLDWIGLDWMVRSGTTFWQHLHKTREKYTFQNKTNDVFPKRFCPCKEG